MAAKKTKTKTTSEVAVAWQVAEATVLNREVKQRAARIEELKVRIRSYAVEVANGRPEVARTAMVQIESKVGTATISFPKDEPKLVEGANPRALKEVLLHSTWEHLFEEKVVLASGFDDKFKLLSNEEQAHVRALIEWKTSEPRVNLPK